MTKQQFWATLSESEREFFRALGEVFGVTYVRGEIRGL